MFTFVDWLVVAVYLTLIIGIGVWTSRGQETKRDYFLGGREMAWWIVGLSIVASETSALTVLGVPAMAFGAMSYKDGAFIVTPGSLFFLMIVVGHVIGRIIITIWVVPYYFKGQVYTTFQLLMRAFGPQTRITASGISLLGMALGQGMRVFVTATPLMIVMRTYATTANFTISHGILIVMLFAIAYTTIGGIKAVVITDMLQYFVFVGGGLIALFYIPTLLHGSITHGGPEGWSAVASIAHDNLHWFNSGLLSHDAIVKALGHEPSGWESLKAQLTAILSAPPNIFMGLIGMPVGIVFALGFDQHNMQRVLGCRNVREGRKAMLLSATLIAPQFFMFLMIGAALYTFYSLHGFAFDHIKPWDPATVDPLTGIGKVKSDHVFPIFIVEEMPIAVKGLMLAAILSAAMSSVSAALSAMGSMFVMDFYKPLTKKKQSDKAELLLSRGSVVVSGLVLIAVAYGMQKSTDTLFDLAFSLAGLTQGALLGPFIYGMIHKRGHPLPAIVGMVTSVCVMIAMNILIHYKQIIPVYWPWHTLIGLLVALGVMYLLGTVFKAHGTNSMDEAVEGES